MQTGIKGKSESPESLRTYRIRRVNTNWQNIHLRRASRDKGQLKPSLVTEIKSRVFPPYPLLKSLDKLRSFKEKTQLRFLRPSKFFQLDKMAQEKENKVMAGLLELDKLKK